MENIVATKGITVSPQAILQFKNKYLKSSLLYVNDEVIVGKLPNHGVIQQIQIKNSVISQSEIFLGTEENKYKIKNDNSVEEGVLLMKNKKVSW